MIHLLKKLLHSVPCALAALLATASAETQTSGHSYANPVIAGDFPDPTVIRVGDTYYAAGTSCDFAPNYPVYQSPDLINWERIGSVFNEPPAWTADDFWAPELYHRDGTFFVYYTAKRKDNRIACIGVASTKDIRKGFTDHGIIIEWGEEAIDAFVFQDDDGKTYITWKAYGLTKGRDIEILASELSADGLKLVGEHFTLTDHAKGWRTAGDEGQVLVKRNGWYYLIYSVGGCCDNKCDYRVVVARSRNLRSGWEQLPEPILEGGGKWRCSGHGTLVTTPDKRDYYLYHAYNEKDFEFVGRQGCLDELVWNKETGWPSLWSGRNPSPVAYSPLNTVQERKSVFEDDFSTAKNLPFFEWDLNVPKPKLEIAGGALRFTPTHKAVNFAGLRPETGDYELRAEVSLTDTAGGIGIYATQRDLLALVADQSELVLFRIDEGRREAIWKTPLSGRDSVFLKYDALNGRDFQFHWSENGTDWKPAGDGRIDGTFLAQWGFSPRVGFIVDGANPGAAGFSGLKVEYQFQD